MPIFYESLSDNLRDWALRQPLFFVSSAPCRGRHINVSPKGLPDSSFAVLSPNKVAYVDSTGSGCETICHLRENGRATVMFCSFDATPRIMRLFCTGSVIEWNDPRYAGYVKRMGVKSLVGARAVIILDIFKVGFVFTVLVYYHQSTRTDLPAGSNILRFRSPTARPHHRSRNK